LCLGCSAAEDEEPAWNRQGDEPVDEYAQLWNRYTRFQFYFCSSGIQYSFYLYCFFHDNFYRMRVDWL